MRQAEKYYQRPGAKLSVEQKILARPSRISVVNKREKPGSKRKRNHTEQKYEQRIGLD
ncbi:hypothetical protein CSC31_3432 [Pseudomonas aeruginosa]|nr:hypothetical protein CSC31_3432 [Pseudomonas aeruginosa]